MSIKFRFHHRYLPFLDFEIELRPNITFLGHPMLLRVSLHSPNRRAALLRIFKPRDRTIFPLIEWPWTDHVVDCVADAIDAYRITQDDAREEPETQGGSDGIPSLHALWHRVATVGYPELWPESWWHAAQRAQDDGANLGPVLRLIQAEMDSLELGDANEQPADDVDAAAAAAAADPDGWREVSEVTLDEWLAWPWWEWRYSATAGHAHKSSRETKSLPVLGQVRRAPIQGDDTDGWREVATITPEEWDAWRRWQWRREPGAAATVTGPWTAPIGPVRKGVPLEGQVRRVPLLEWPEMDGERWTDARDVTQAMIDAWPVWEVDRGDFVAVVPGAGVTVSGALAGQWRPLRLPGMSTDLATIGEIAGGDMTREHFERVDEWTVRHNATRPWSTPWSYKERGMPAIIRPYKRWRPAAFGQV